MTTTLSQLNEMVGIYVGDGINHEGQPFVGRLQIENLLDGRGFHVKFTATGRDGEAYHREESTIAPSSQGVLTLWNFNTNTPGVVPHELGKSDKRSGSQLTLIFGFGQPSDKSTFREEVTLEIWDGNSLSYTYSWGLPGGEFQERSSVRMTKQNPAGSSARALLEKYKVEINKHDFGVLEPLISPDCKFWFSSGTFVGLQQTRQAFEKTWAMIKDEVYALTEIQWIAESEQAAVCTYTYHWKGLIDGKPCEGRGRGTSCFRKETDGWKIIHEHLSGFPK